MISINKTFPINKTFFLISSSYCILEKEIFFFLLLFIASDSVTFYSLVWISSKGLQSLYLFEQYANYTLLDVPALE